MVGTTEACHILYIENGAYKSTTVAGTNTYANYGTRVLYYYYSTEDIPVNSRIVGNANISVKGDRASVYRLYNTQYETINSTCTFDEFTDDEKLLGEYEQTVNWTAFNFNIDFNSSKLDIKSNGNINIAVVDNNDNGIVARCTEAPTLTVNYITLD